MKAIQQEKYKNSNGILYKNQENNNKKLAKKN